VKGLLATSMYEVLVYSRSDANQTAKCSIFSPFLRLRTCANVHKSTIKYDALQLQRPRHVATVIVKGGFTAATSFSCNGWFISPFRTRTYCCLSLGDQRASRAAKRALCVIENEFSSISLRKRNSQWCAKIEKYHEGSVSEGRF